MPCFGVLAVRQDVQLENQLLIIKPICALLIQVHQPPIQFK